MQANKYRNELSYLGRAFADVYGECKSVVHSYGTSKASIRYPDRRLRPYYGDLKEGGIVIDMSACDYALVSKMVISHAMVDVDLAPGMVSSGWGDCKKTEPGTLENSGSLDYIALDVYADFWHNNGAKVGKREGNFIIWRNGDKEEIPGEDSANRWALEDLR